MRKKIVAANWKMNLNLEEGSTLVAEVLKGLSSLTDNHRVVIAPTFLHITSVSQQLQQKEHIYLGAQNCYSENSGAYTGEIAAPMLQDAGVSYVILGHSERRQYFNESNAMLAAKINNALANNLQVIFCCGEPLAIRDADTQNTYVETQLNEGLFHLDANALKNVVIAYEPIWAIGTGRTASSQQAQDMHAHIRQVVATKYGTEAAQDITILYGGSCKPNNAGELFACPDVDGGLIGGASLKADEFLGIISAMIKS